MTQFVEMYTDGSWDPVSKNGGWAYLVSSNGDALVEYGGEGGTTINRMELKAVIQGLDRLSNPSIVQLVSDSKYVVNGISSWLPNWKRNNWIKSTGKPVENKDLWIELDNRMQVHTVYASWVKAHVKFVQTVKQKANEMVDYFANVGRYENIGLKYEEKSKGR